MPCNRNLLWIVDPDEDRPLGHVASPALASIRQLVQLEPVPRGRAGHRPTPATVQRAEPCEPVPKQRERGRRRPVAQCGDHPCVSQIEAVCAGQPGRRRPRRPVLCLGPQRGWRASRLFSARGPQLSLSPALTVFLLRDPTARVQPEMAWRVECAHLDALAHSAP